MRTIFLIELEGGKYFLYASMKPNSPIELFLEAYFQNEYIQKYKPMNILDTWPETHLLDLDIHVKKQMLERGIDNVRGGSYSSTILNPSQLHCLTIELQSPTHECHKDVIKEIFDTYVAKKWLPSALIKHRNRLYSDYSFYKKEKEAHDKLCEINIMEAMNDIDWLEHLCIIQYDNFVSGSISNHLFSTEVVPKYHTVLRKLRKIYNTFMTVSNNLPIQHNDLPIKYPEFIFDNFVFYGQRILLEKDNIHRFCDQYRFFLLYLENRISESTFDVASWKTETFYKYSILFLDLSIV
jgi:hypothetical protein